ncbi:hypothetical protein FOZ63_016654, partial [Perkinsus olseni]
FKSYTVVDDPLSNIKARRYLSWISELEASKFHEQLDRQAQERLLKPSQALGYALTTPTGEILPDSLRVVHLAFDRDQVVTLAQLQRQDESLYQGVRVCDIMK